MSALVNRGLAVAVAAIVAAVTLGSDVAAAGQEKLSPVGTWAVLITFPGQERIEHALLSLRPDGSLIHADAHRTGLGSWQPTADGFRFALRHYNAKPGEEFSLEVRIKHEGRLTSPDSFTSAGTGTALDANGNVIVVNQSRMDAKRYSLADAFPL